MVRASTPAERLRRRRHSAPCTWVFGLGSCAASHPHARPGQTSNAAERQQSASTFPLAWPFSQRLTAIKQQPDRVFEPGPLALSPYPLSAEEASPEECSGSSRAALTRQHLGGRRLAPALADHRHQHAARKQEYIARAGGPGAKDRPVPSQRDGAGSTQFSLTQRVTARMRRRSAAGTSPQGRRSRQLPPWHGSRSVGGQAVARRKGGALEGWRYLRHRSARAAMVHS